VTMTEAPATWAMQRTQSADENIALVDMFDLCDAYM
jgi:hypothetical protein